MKNLLTSRVLLKNLKVIISLINRNLYGTLDMEKSYTTFDYVDCALSDTLLAASDTLKVSVYDQEYG